MINQGRDPYEIMRSIELPPALRVGQGYGKVSWAARTIFESYTGWFQRRSTAALSAARIDMGDGGGDGRGQQRGAVDAVRVISYNFV